MDGTPNDSQMTPQLLRLRQFLAWLVPIAIGFALLETCLFLIDPHLQVGATAVITTGYLVCLLVAQRRLRQSQIESAVTLICIGLLVADPLAVLVWPNLLPALLLLPVIAVAIALPYLGGAAIRRLIRMSMLVAVLASLLSVYASPVTSVPPWLLFALHVTSIVAATLLALLLLEQFRSRLSETIGRMQTAQQGLEDRNERLAVTLQSIGDGVITTDAEGRVVSINPMMERLTGWSQAEALGKHLGDILSLDEGAQRTPLLDRVQEDPARITYIAEARIVARDQATYDVSGTAAAIRTRAGAAIGVVLALHDVSAQKRAAEERLMWERQLLETQKLESLGVLAGGIAHDFNNLLMGVMGNASLAFDMLDPGAPAREKLKQIELAATRAAELTRQMLAYAGKGRFVLQPIDLNELIVEMAALLRASIGKHVALQFDLAAHLPLIEGDPTQMRQIVMNLIVNAAEAIGTVAGSITIRTRPYRAGAERAESANVVVGDDLPERAIVLDVIDTGSGMDDATIARIFEPFFTTKFTGRGLGLSAVLGIIRAHHGRLVVKSLLGRGTTFSIALPALEALALGTPAPAAPSASAARPATVLVVDDDNEARSITTDMLQHHGYTVIAASDGQEAVEIYRTRSGAIDCVLLDLIMPRMNGVVAFEQIQQINGAALVVLMSGYSEQEAARHISRPGLAGFLQKPFTMSVLADTIRQALERRS